MKFNMSQMRKELETLRDNQIFSRIYRIKLQTFKCPQPELVSILPDDYHYATIAYRKNGEDWEVGVSIQGVNENNSRIVGEVFARRAFRDKPLLISAVKPTFGKLAAEDAVWTFAHSVRGYNGKHPFMRLVFKALEARMAKE